MTNQFLINIDLVTARMWWKKFKEIEQNILFYLFIFFILHMKSIHNWKKNYRYFFNKINYRKKRNIPRITIYAYYK